MDLRSTSFLLYFVISCLKPSQYWTVVLSGGLLFCAKQTDGPVTWPTSSSGLLSRKKGKLSRRGKIQRCVDECKAYIIYYFWFNSLPLFERFLDCFVLFWPLIGANLSFSSIFSSLLISLNVSDLTGQKVGQNSNQPQTKNVFYYWCSHN